MALNRKLSDKPLASSCSSNARVHIYEPEDLSQSPTGSDYQIPASYLRDVNLQEVTDIGNSTTNSIYSTNSVNAIDESNGNKLSLKSDGLYFVNEDALSTAKLIQSTAGSFVTVEMPAIDGRLLTTSGTEVGNPVTGSIQFIPYTDKGNLYVKAYDDEAGLFMDTNEMGLGLSNSVLGTFSNLSVLQDKINIKISEPSSRGIVGEQDFTANITDFDYTQEIYVIPRGGTKVGKPITGDLEISDNINIKGSVGGSIRNFRYNDEGNTIIENIEDGSPDIFTQITIARTSNSVFVSDAGGATFSATQTAYDFTIDSSNPLSKGITSPTDFTDNITDLDYTQKIYVDGSVQRTTLTSGSFTPTATPSDLIIIHEAGATATLTINMPTVPRDKQKVTIMSVGGITDLTLATAVGSILNTVTSLVAGVAVRYVWLDSQSKWYKI